MIVVAFLIIQVLVFAQIFLWIKLSYYLYRPPQLPDYHLLRPFYYTETYRKGYIYPKKALSLISLTQSVKILLIPTTFPLL